MNSEYSSPAGIRRFAKLTFASTLFLIFAGAMVTSTNSGLAVPDWPLSYGQVFPPMVGGIFFEHGHRLIASGVGLMMIVLAVWMHRREPKSHVRILGWVGLAVVVAQGVLGGLTVILRLPAEVSIAHAGVAEIFLAITAAIAFYTSRAHSRIERNASVSPLFAKLLAAAVYAQIIVGAWMRHIGAGLAIPDFPLAYGRLIPPLETREVIAAFSHRIGAAIVLVLIAFGIGSAMRSNSNFVRRSYVVLLLIVMGQIMLGAFTIWTERNPVITSLHVVTGALLLAWTVIHALGVSAAFRNDREPVGEMEGSEVTA